MQLGPTEFCMSVRTWQPQSVMEAGLVFPIVYANHVPANLAARRLDEPVVLILKLGVARLQDLKCFKLLS